MKHIQKILAQLLAVLLVITACVPATLVGHALETEDAEALCEFFTEARRRRREMIHHGSR